MKMGTASRAMTSGCLTMASPWKANSSTSVASSAAMATRGDARQPPLERGLPAASRMLAQHLGDGHAG